MSFYLISNNPVTRINLIILRVKLPMQDFLKYGYHSIQEPFINDAAKFWPSHFQQSRAFAMIRALKTVNHLYLNKVED